MEAGTHKKKKRGTLDGKNGINNPEKGLILYKSHWKGRKGDRFQKGEKNLEQG